MNYPNINPEIFSLDLGFFILAPRWYGLMYLLSIVFIYLFLYKNKKFLKFKISLDDYLFYNFILMIIFARIGYVFLYNIELFLYDPLYLFEIWNGGLSFHGAMFGLIFFNLIYLFKKKINFLNFTNVFIIPIPIGLLLGRIGNFINNELWGRTTDVSWCFNIDYLDGCRHPSQLYEAFFEGLILFLILYYLSKSRFDKYVFSAFLIFYSLFRFVLEYFREPDSQLGYILYNYTMGQILSFVLLILGLIFFCFSYKKDRQLDDIKNKGD